MKILLVSPILSSEYDSGKYILKALCELGHYVSVWDYRLQPDRIEFPEYDLVIVNKGEIVNPEMFEEPRVLWYPDHLSRFDVRDKLEKYTKVYSINKPEHGYEWVEWLPGCYDPDIHKSLSIERKADYIYIGTGNSHRKVKFILDLNPDFVFGNNWISEIQSSPPVYGLKFTWFANNAKILLNIHQSDWGTNRKLFELIPCGFTLTDRVEGVEDILGDLTNKVSFETPEEGKELIFYYLNNEVKREIIWEEEKKAIEKYTYKNQIQKILKEVS